jgi:hypothetical protein
VLIGLKELQVCPFSDGTPTNPRILGNVTSYSYSGVECDYYSYEIAAINANGTGIYSNKSPTDYIAVGDDEITVTNLGEGSVEINYSSFSCVSGWAFVSVSGNLHNYEDAAFSGNIVDTYVDFDENNAGTIYFNGQSPGIYKVKIWETWSAEEEGSCTEQRHGCLEVPFEITS